MTAYTSGQQAAAAIEWAVAGADTEDVPPELAGWPPEDLAAAAGVADICDVVAAKFGENVQLPD